MTRASIGLCLVPAFGGEGEAGRAPIGAAVTSGALRYDVGPFVVVSWESDDGVVARLREEDRLLAVFDWDRRTNTASLSLPGQERGLPVALAPGTTMTLPVANALTLRLWELVKDFDAARWKAIDDERLKSAA